MLFAQCAYCKGYGHYKSHCLKLITKNASNSTLCREYNRFKNSACEKDSYICTQGREHRCSICRNIDCKAYLHIHQQGRFESKDTKCSVVKELVNLVKEIASQLVTLRKDCEDIKNRCKDFMQEEQQIVSSECEWPTPTPVLLPNNRYLALPVISVNKVLNMPVSTGFPLSAVSKNHAREVLKATKSDILSHPDMSPSTNCLSMADGQPLSINERVAVPLTFANGRTISFEMLVLEYLSHDIVFGQNHLEKLGTWK